MSVQMSSDQMMALAGRETLRICALSLPSAPGLAMPFMAIFIVMPGTKAYLEISKPFC